MINVEDGSDVAFDQLRKSITDAEQREESGIPIPIGLMESLIDKVSGTEIVNIDPYASLAIEALRLYSQSTAYSGQQLIQMPTEMIDTLLDLTEENPGRTTTSQNKNVLTKY
jgi:hypothetical protein